MRIYRDTSFTCLLSKHTRSSTIKQLPYLSRSRRFAGTTVRLGVAYCLAGLLVVSQYPRQVSAAAFQVTPRQQVRRKMVQGSTQHDDVDVNCWGGMDPGVFERTMAPLHVQTPLIRSNPLTELCGGRPVYLKLDALQPSGSFKLRGIGYTCQKAVASGAKCLVSSSGGNAGLATAHAGRALAIPTTVVVPETTPAFIRERLRGYGAQVVVHGSQWSQANERAMELADQLGGKLVHPFEGADDTWIGHATLVHEIRRDLMQQTVSTPIPAAIVTCVGGGGLLAGILTGLDQVGWSSSDGLVVPVVAMETVGADSLHASIEAGTLVTLPAISSVAKSLGAAAPSPTVLKMCLDRGPDLVRSNTVTDKEAVTACLQFADDHRILVEPACGAALAALYSDSQRQHLLHSLDNTNDSKDRPIVVQVCGGAIVDRASLDALAQQFNL